MKSSCFLVETKPTLRIFLAKDIVSSIVPSPSCPNISGTIYKIKFSVRSVSRHLMGTQQSMFPQ